MLRLQIQSCPLISNYRVKL
uniref:Uncharacterized protein n=1 Tax=Anguilla anguilla TaxID=7936 RepID=A0A0E9UEQ1_ANGAN